MKKRLSDLGDRFWHKWLGIPYHLHTVDHGGSGPEVVLLHGLGSSIANWDHLIPLIGDRYRCITVDLLGFGDSPKPTWSRYDMEDHMRSVAHTLRRLRLGGEPVTLIGHSMGSLIATRYTRLFGGRVARLVLLSPPVYAPLYTIKNRAARGRTSMYLKAYKFLRNHPRATPENITKLRRLLPQLKFLTLTPQTWTPFVRSLEHCIEQQTLIDDLRHTVVPTDVFYGTLDEVVVPYNVKQLAQVRAVNLYPLNVQHAVSKRYATAVASVLSA